ncbi:MAG: S8 family serine peptidase [Proteobacteria bacterium]|nr:S8 family serine peptidase [Pseudomonadota bacterium]
MRRILAFGLLLAAVASLSAAAAAPRSDDASFIPTFRGFADPRGTGMTDALRAKLQQFRPNDRVQVIVTFDEDGGDSFFARQSVGNFDLKHDFRTFSGFAATVSAAQASALSTLPGVFRVEEDMEVSITLDAANLDFGAEYARTDFGVSGAGVRVCVIDTGIDPDHEQFDDPGKIVGWADFVEEEETPYDDHGHGTHVANILAGAGTGGPDAFKYRGVAPGASIIAVKVLNSAGSGSGSDIIAGIEFCVAEGADIISMSLGGAPTDGLDAMSRAVNAAVDNGVVAVISAGNSGDEHETIGTPGAAEKAITVGAVTDWSATEGIHLAPWSSRGPNLAGLTKPDTVAPGVLIAAARAGTASGYVLFSGTSMSAPYVAGAVALMKEINPSLTPPQVKSLIHTWSQDWGVAGIDNDYGAGLIDVYALVGAAAGVTPEPTVFPEHQVLAASVPNDGTWTFDFEIGADALNVPIAATILIDGQAVCLGWFWRCTSQWSPDLDAELYDPTGQRLDLSECLAGSECGDIGHQETLHAMPTVAGTYTLRVYPYSGSPNNGLGGDFTVDLSAGPVLLVLGPTDDPPTASMTAPANNATVAGPVLIQVQADDTEDAPGDLTVEVRIDGGGWQSAAWNAGASRYEYSWNSASVGDGAHTIDARATDGASNTTSAAQISVTVDNVDEAPSAAITSPADGATVSGAVLVQVQADDAEDAPGDLTVEVRIDGGGWQAAAWNSGSSRYEWTWNTPGADNGVSHLIQARATDSAANAADASSINVTADNVDDPPSAAITSPADGANVSGAVLVQVQAADAEDAPGDLTVEVRIDTGAWQAAAWNAGASRYEWTWNTPGGDDGVAHTISARATDGASNTTDASLINVTVDNVDAAPSADLTAPGNNATVAGPVLIQVQADDAEDAPGSLTVEMRIDGGGWQAAAWNAGASRYEYSWNSASVGDGGHTIDARATDSASNTTNAAQISVTTDNVDEAPSAGLTAPGNNATVAGPVLIQVQADDTEDAPGDLTVEVRIDGGGWQSAAWNAGANRYEYSWNSASVGDGAHTINARATDSASNTTNAAQISVAVDNVDEAPSAGISSPANGATVSGAVLVQVQADDAEDAAGTLNVDIAIDGGTWQNATWNAGASRYEWTWNTPGGDDGVAHSISARATDSGANTTDASSINVTVDNVDAAPSAGIDDPGASLQGTVILQVQASDVEDAAGTLDVDISIDSGSWQNATWNAATTRYELAWDTTGAANGGHTIDARATDSAANTGNAPQLNVTVDNPAVLEVHVGDLDGTSTPSGSRRWIASVTIMVHGANELPVAGANVSGDWSRGSASGSCTTGADGTCTVSTGTMSRWRRSIAYTVEDITGSTYDPDANHDPDGDSDGTTITFSRPSF